MVSLQVNNIDPKWKKLFDSAGITEKELEDEETSKFIYDFVEKHGGIERAAAEMEECFKPLPQPPSRDDSKYCLEICKHRTKTEGPYSA